MEHYSRQQMNTHKISKHCEDSLKSLGQNLQFKGISSTTLKGGLNSEIIKAESCMYFNNVKISMISSGNGLLPAWHQAITDLP